MWWDHEMHQLEIVLVRKRGYLSYIPVFYMVAVEKQLLEHTSEECAVSIIQICHGPCKHQSCQGFDPHVEKYETQDPVTFEDVTVKITIEEWALLSSSQKKLYSGVMKETFLNLISTAQEEKFGDYCKDPKRKMGTQVIEKECGYACDNDCDKNQDPDRENIININMHPTVSVHERTLYVRNMIGHSSSYGYGRVQTTESPSMWRKPTATAFIHQKHWEDISPSQSLQVLEISPEEKLCKSPHLNEAYTSLCLDQPQERTQTGEILNENDLTRDRNCQNGEVIHTEVKQFVGQLCEEAFSNSSDLVNHENSHIGKKRDNCRQPGKTFKYGKCFEKHKLAVTIEKPYACEHCGKDFSERSSCTRHERVHTAEKLFTCKDFRKTFSYHSHLKSHELIHTGEKPYACKHGRKAFTRCSNLKTHERNHSGEKPYACKHCGKTFTSSSLIISLHLFLLGDFASSCSRAFSFHLVDLSIGWNLPSSAFCKAGFVDSLMFFLWSRPDEPVWDPDGRFGILWEDTSIPSSRSYKHIWAFPDSGNTLEELMPDSEKEKEESLPSLHAPRSGATCRGPVSGRAVCLRENQEPVTFEDVSLNFTLEEWALLNSSQKKLYSGVMKETFLNLIFIGTVIEEKLGEDCKDLRRKMRTQVIEKECGYACDSDCHKNQFPVLENNINTDIHPVVCVHESSLCVRNMIGHSSSHGYGRVQTTVSPSIWRKPTATAFIHQMHWKDISPSQSLQVLEISPEEKLCKSQQFNEACTSLCFDQPQERTQTGENLDENDLTRDTYGQNGEVIHTEVKQFVGQLCEEAFSNSSDLINDENSHIDKKMDNCRQSGKTFKYPKCFEKYEVAVTGEKPYACVHCGKAFSESSSCKRHVRVHIAEKLFASKDFRNTFSYHSHLKSHEQNQTREKPHACKNCGKSFNWCSDLKTHERTHTGEKPYACRHCGKAFTQSSHLKKHVQIYTGEKPYACTHCGKAFTQSSYLKAHVQIHIGEKCYSCKYCGKAFKWNNNLKTHEWIHTGEKPYGCKHCGKAFTQSFHLKTHVQIHVGEKPYACKHCGKAFNRCSDLKLHEWIHTGEKPYACKHCGKGFTQSRYLKTHVRIHIGEKPYACEHCGKAFKQHSHLKSHEQIHTGEKPYACKHCGKAFNWYNNLKTHERIHTGEKPYACKHCGKAFTQSSCLKAHVQIHIGEKPYACNYCGKGFTQSFHLKTHERIHTGEKPYACKHCGKAFTQSSCRKAHERIHTGEKPYACKQCGKAFSCSSSLKTHEWCHNGKKPYAWLQQQFWKQQWWCPLENGPVDL
ncbi:hypothetical protein STEG23_008444 [Scotinomys teguina]